MVGWLQFLPWEITEMAVSCRMTKDTCLRAWRIAKTTREKRLLDACVPVIGEHFGAVCGTDAFKELGSAADVLDLMSIREVADKLTDAIKFDAVTLWLLADEGSRKETAGDLMAPIDLKRVPLEVLSTFKAEHGAVFPSVVKL